MIGLSVGRRRVAVGPEQRRRRWFLPIAVWAVVAAIGIGIGPKALSAPWDDDPLSAPFVSLAIRGNPTLTWTGPSAGTVLLSYDVQASDSGAEVRLRAGIIVNGRVTRPVREEIVQLAGGRVERRTVQIPVSCRKRVQLGVQATGPGLQPAQIHTWAEPTTDKSGGPVCRLI